MCPISGAADVLSAPGSPKEVIRNGFIKTPAYRNFS